MRLTPRKAEVQEMNTILNADHADVDAASKAALKRAADLLGGRPWYTIAIVRDGYDALFFGLYSSEKEAEKGLKLHAKASDAKMVVVQINSMDMIEARSGGTPLPGDCTCGHDKGMHHMEGSSYGRCGMSTCECGKFTKHDWPYPAFNREGDQ